MNKNLQKIYVFRESTTIALKPHSLAGTAEVILAMCKSMKWKEVLLLELKFYLKTKTFAIIMKQ